MIDNFKLSFVSLVLSLLLFGCTNNNGAEANLNVNMTNICLLLENGLSVASTADCSSYYTCQNGNAMMHRCSNGYLFDKNLQSCVLPSQSSCTPAGQNPCTNHAVGIFMPVTGSCGGYWYCGSNGPVRGNCPTGENFNPYKQICAYSINYPCTQTPTNNRPNGPNGPNGPIPIDGSSSEEGSEIDFNLCNYIPNGYYFGSPSECNAWNYCENNVLRSGQCQTGMDFNVEKMICDYAQNVDCSQVTNDPLLVESDNAGGDCTKLNQRKAASACNHYFNCNGQQYQLTECPTGLYYDTVSQVCVSRMMARNNCDRCVSTTSTFVNEYSTTNCSKYLICKHGVEVGSGTCPEGFFFNEMIGACSQAGDPSFGCCNPSVFLT